MIKYIIIIFLLLLLLLLLYNKRDRDSFNNLDNYELKNSLSKYISDTYNFKNINIEDINVNDKNNIISNNIISNNIVGNNIDGLDINFENINSTGNLITQNIIGSNLNLRNINNTSNLIAKNITGEDMNMRNIISTGNLTVNNIIGEDINIRNINSNGNLRINNITGEDISANIVEFKNIKNNSSEISYIWGLTSSGNVYRCPTPCTLGTDWKKINSPMIPGLPYTFTLGNINVGKDFIYGSELNNTAPILWKCKKPCDNGNWELIKLPTNIYFTRIIGDNYI